MEYWAYISDEYGKTKLILVLLRKLPKPLIKQTAADKC